MSRQTSNLRAFTFRVHFFFLSTILTRICTAQNGVLPIANDANFDILLVVHPTPRCAANNVILVGDMLEGPIEVLGMEPEAWRTASGVISSRAESEHTCQLTSKYATEQRVCLNF
ncbi:hypothetical protein C8F01DRAFT_1130461 [Mycena amicta]|nr:hypothetical protein C8F01DRAFT_1130461 [Mycena amicta]